MLLTFVLFTVIASFPCTDLCETPGCLDYPCMDECGEMKCHENLLCYELENICVVDTFRPASNPDCSTLNMCLDDICLTDDDCSSELYCHVDC